MVIMQEDIKNGTIFLNNSPDIVYGVYKLDI